MELTEHINAFKACPHGSGFVLDFDGTLAEIVTDPNEAEIDAGAVPVLEALSRRYRLTAVVSGRRAQDVAGRVGVAGLRYLGLYGAEEWTDAGLIQPGRAEGWRRQARELQRGAESLILKEGLAGCRVEMKDMAVSLHFRSAVSAGAPDVLLAWAEEVAPEVGFQAGMGRKVVELRPAGVSKAGVVEQLAGDEGLKNLLVAGDDLTDVEMMTRAGHINRLHVLRVGVSSEEAPAGLADQTDLLVGSTKQMVQLLGRFV